MLKITDNHKRIVKTFEELAVGQVFYCGSSLLMKTSQDDNEDNAVNLRNGDTRWIFTDGTEVTPVDAELIIH